MNIRYQIILLVGLIFLSCQEDKQPSQNSGSEFVDLSSLETGIDFRNDLHYTADLNIIEYLYFNNGGGVAVGDIDNDGFEDLCFTSNQGVDRLYKNLGGLRFKDITETAGLRMDSTWSTGVVIDDINNDGFKDIHISKVAHSNTPTVHNLLYINQGDGTFLEESKKYGLDFSGYSTQISFADIDLDGDLDAYLLNHSTHSTASYGSTEKRKVADERSGDRLFENKTNQGEARFVDVTASSGIYSSALGYGLGLTTSDINGDGYPDIYVGNDFHENDYLYINQKDNTFKESIAEYTAHTSQFTMGVDAADMNNDGTLDLFTADMMPYDPEIYLRSGGNDTEQLKKVKKNFGFQEQYTRNHFYINHVGLQFSEQANITKTFATDWSWSVLLQDFDNNGLPDIFISNGIINRPNDLDYINYINTPENRIRESESEDAFNKRLIDQMPSLKLENILFLQEGNLMFSEVNNSKIGVPNYSNGAAYADLDNDGTLEIICNNVNGPASIMSLGVSNNFIGVRLEHERDKTAKGSRVYLYRGDKIMMREYTTTRGFQSSSSHKIHFGLGNLTAIDSLKVIWNNESQSILISPEINKYHKVKKAEITSKQIVEQTQQDHDYDINALQIRHIKNDFDDLDSEPLMHRKYSAEGPAFLVEDLNGDGFKDIFLGGSRGNAAQYLEGSATDQFLKRAVKVFDKDARYEDVDAALIDFNKDGHQDIYVVSGGNDKNQLDESLQDRIYFNDGNGDFLRLPLSLPHMNGSTIAVHDYDGDGYEDMFVGASNIPGAYGVSPLSFILKNEQGAAVSIVHKAKLGMLNDAQWVDLDGDDTKELVAVGEWSKPVILKVQNDTSFTEVSDILSQRNVMTGMYRSIDIGDINADGKVDILIGNQGYNTAWQDNGVELYLDDFDENSFIDPIIMTEYNGKMIPFISKSELQKQIPSIRKTFPDYLTFSKVDGVETLFKKTKNGIKKSISIEELGSYMLLSGVDGYYKVMLPRAVQMTTINSMLWLPNLYGGSLVVCGNDHAASHALGNSLANAVSIYSDYDNDTKTFEQQTRINIPTGTVVKKAVTYSDNSILLCTNNGPLYLLDFK